MHKTSSVQECTVVGSAESVQYSNKTVENTPVAVECNVCVSFIVIGLCIMSSLRKVLCKGKNQTVKSKSQSGIDSGGKLTEACVASDLVRLLTLHVL